MRQHVLILYVLILCIPVLAAGPAQARDRALVIGINQYPGISDGARAAARELRGAVPDAHAFTDLLVDIFRFERSDIRLLTDAQATQEAILSGIREWLIAGSGPGDRAVFYFAGHGATALVNEADGKQRLTSTLVPADAAGDVGRSISRMIEGRTIGRLLEQLKDRRVMVVADACQSGSVTRELGGVTTDPPLVARTLSARLPVGLAEADYTPALQAEAKSATPFIEQNGIDAVGENLAVWAATTLFQVTYDLRDGSGGVFTQSFIKGLRDRAAAKPGTPGITAGALLNYVRTQSESFCAKYSGTCRGLTPNLKASAAYRTAQLAPDPGAAAPQNTAAQATADATNLLEHRNDFDLDAEILPGVRARLGDVVRFRIRAAEAGTLVVLDSGPDGKLRQIFPNAQSMANNVRGQVRAGAPITIPDQSYGFVFRATDAGPGTLMVLVAEQALDLSHVIGAHLDMKPVPDPRGLVVEYTEPLQAAHVTPDLNVPNGRYRWAFRTVPYEIVR